MSETTMMLKHMRITACWLLLFCVGFALWV